LERLQKIIARAGICARRKAEDLILKGKVTVNGTVVKQLGTKADVKKDQIRVNGKLIPSNNRKYYYIAYKPKRMLTSLYDPRARPTILDLLHRNKIRVRLFPVGRLDWDADGLLLLTNDGELANRVMHPRAHLKKVNRVKVRGYPRESDLQILRDGVMIDKNVRTLPVQIVIEGTGENTTWLQITLIEGRQNQVKRMFAHIGYSVVSIRRTAIGPLQLKDLRIGEVRALTSAELTRLKRELR